MALPDKCPLCFAGIDSICVVTPHVYGDCEKKRAFFHCSACDVNFQHPGLSSDEEKKFYAAEFESFMASRSGIEGGWDNAEKHVLANEDTRVRRMQYLEPHLKQRGARILEVGCSSGFMLYPLSDLGHQCVGIEPSGVFQKYVQSRNLQVFDSTENLIQAQPNTRFDIVMHFFVLEHIREPKQFLESQLKLLNPGGVIIFEIPNSADPLYSVYDIPAFERFYWSMAHPWYFGEKSLAYLLNQLDRPYEILRDQRYDLSNHMVWARDGRPGGMARFTDIIGIDVEENYKKGLIKSGRCDTLVGIVHA